MFYNSYHVSIEKSAYTTFHPTIIAKYIQNKTLVLVNSLFLIFNHSKLELLKQLPESNHEKYLKHI